MIGLILGTSMRRTLRGLPFFCAIFYLAAVAFLLHTILVKTSGHFGYTLDDPYIHLALAENLAHGHYGINPTEFSSPSSSLLWPLILVPFTGSGVQVYTPLVWNMIFGVIAACLIGLLIGRYPPQGNGVKEAYWKQAVTVVLLIFVANLPGLTFTGMEHVLQVMLAICCVYGMTEAFAGRMIPAWCVAAAVIAPSVRYEDLTLTLAMACAFVGLGRWKRAAGVFILSALPLVAFALYLKSKGLPGLPLSVLVKGEATPGTNLVHRLFELVKNELHQSVVNPERFPIVALFLIFAAMATRERVKQRRWVFVGASLLGGLQLLIGQFGGFHRYEVYALIFLVLLYMRVLAELPRFPFGYFAMGLLFCASTYIGGTFLVPDAALSVYGQQYQMHRFVTEFYKSNYAVNDLGLVSYQRTPGAYVLDLWGLGSLEASRQTNKSAAWMTDVAVRHNAPLAIVYPDWFHIPGSWTPIGRMCVTSHAVEALGEKCVVFFSTSSEGIADIHSELERFAGTLPSGDTFELITGPEHSSGVSDGERK